MCSLLTYSLRARHLRQGSLLVIARVQGAAMGGGSGLVSWVVPAANLDEALEERVGALMAAGTEAQAAIKQLVPLVLATNSPAAMRDYSTRLIAERRASAEGREGLTAFLERRRPSWVAGESSGR